VSIPIEPDGTVVALAENANAGGGGSVTVTLAEAKRVKPPPTQVNVKEVLDVRAADCSIPERDFSPDHPPDAAHDVALRADQAS
jgi:hypothetical protein